MGERNKQKQSRLFSLDVVFFTGEKYKVEKCSSKMLVIELKERLELIIGIPVHLLRLFYLDAADLIDSQPLKYVDIIPGAVLKATVWNEWLGLVEAIIEGDVFKVFRQGVTKDSKYNDANSSTMLPRARVNWLQERGNVALFIASSRGQNQIVTRLLLSGCNVSAKTPMGRTPLHVTGSQGHVQNLLTLLQFGASTDIEDQNGETALSLAASMGQRMCERHLFMHEWQQRAARTAKYVDKRPLMAHQMYDTHLKTWYSGRYRKLYTAEILPPSEYSGTRINAPKRVPVAPRSFTAPEKATRRPTLFESLESEKRQRTQSRAENARVKAPTVLHEAYLPKTHALKSVVVPKTADQNSRKHENWISRKPQNLLEQLGVGHRQ